jgi:hypothetical protein
MRPGTIAIPAPPEVGLMLGELVAEVLGGGTTLVRVDGAV